MKKKRTVINIIPSKTNVARIDAVLTQLQHSFGKFNCTIDENYAIIIVNYAIPESQIEETMAICGSHCCLPVIVIGPEDSEYVKPNHFELPLILWEMTHYNDFEISKITEKEEELYKEFCKNNKP